MKRQSNVDRSSVKGVKFEGATMVNKKAKRAVDQKEGKEEVVLLGKVEEERKRDGGDQLGLVVAVADDQNVVMGWEESYWPWMSGGVVVDEQMSWGSIWLPSWDMEFMGEGYNGLFSDVLCDDDIWGIRGVKEAPNP
ncbi:hypothetical protein FNV43_RR26606 [Rhamnella rubrinervis]|uniref:Uncharacterized protein n=1 Tax=Rhamnella rubrinervis TaxID=2594499 RepID=A0A8K0DJ35_9ROSA|nr:hypothetical protein FNV43_RR26606 [Rhamnella rubrinervis]